MQGNRSLSLNLTNGESRVPPLPNDFIASSDHVTNTLASPLPLSKRRWSQNHGPAGSSQTPNHNKKRHAEHSIHQALGMLQSVEDPAKCHRIVVQESIAAGLSKELAEHLKDCEIELERIDQELLELGPFSKDMEQTLLPLKVETSVLRPMSVGTGGVHTLTSPTDMLIGVHHQHPSRRPRKGNRQSYTGSKDTRRKSDDSSSPGAGVTSDKGGDQLLNDKMLGKEKEGKELQPKSKWRKVGSAGSPVIHSPASHLPSKKPFLPHSFSDVGSPVSDSRVLPPPSRSVPKTTVSKSKPRGKGGVDTNIDSPSMIPAASEIEMLSLYMPNSQWETIGSSPLQPDHESTEITSQSASRGDLSILPSSGTKNGDPSTGTGLSRTDRSLSQSISSPDSDNTASSERTHNVLESDSVSHLHQFQTHPTAPNSVSRKSPLTTSVACHSSELAINSRSSSTPTSAHQGELRRHVVVRDGAPVVSKPTLSVASISESHRVSSPTIHHHTVKDNQSATLVDKTGVSSLVAGHGNQNYPPHLNSNATSVYVKHRRRTSSSSSMRSVKQYSLDDGNLAQLTPPPSLPPPPPHQRVASVSSPLMMQQQQQVQFMGGE